MVTDSLSHDHVLTNCSQWWRFAGWAHLETDQLCHSYLLICKSSTTHWEVLYKFVFFSHIRLWILWIWYSITGDESGASGQTVLNDDDLIRSWYHFTLESVFKENRVSALPRLRLGCVNTLRNLISKIQKVKQHKKRGGLIFPNSRDSDRLHTER